MSRSEEGGEDREQSQSRRDGMRSRSRGRQYQQQQQQEDDEPDSDPEDSETPWTCHLVVRRLVRSSLSSSDPNGGAAGAGDVRVKVGAVVPAPHHPKVVALLKVPFPLPDIEIARVSVRKRVITPAGVARPAPFADERPGTANGGAKPGQGGGGGSGSGMKGLFGARENGQGGHGAAGHHEGLVLTAEEIKDVVSSTALWLVVREGFGGVGRVSRKGDGGWRIR